MFAECSSQAQSAQFAQTSKSSRRPPQYFNISIPRAVITSGKNLFSKFGGNLVRGFRLGQSGQIWAKKAKLVGFVGLACFDLLVVIYSYSRKIGQHSMPFSIS
jgi:hypothetical protein